MQEIQETQQESIISDSENNNIPLTKKKRTINAPRSEKQIEAFKKAQEKRDENRRIVKEQKEIKLAKLYMENKLKEQQQPEPKETKPLKKEKNKLLNMLKATAKARMKSFMLKNQKRKLKNRKKLFMKVATMMMNLQCLKKNQF